MIQSNDLIYVQIYSIIDSYTTYERMYVQIISDTLYCVYIFVKNKGCNCGSIIHWHTAEHINLCFPVAP